MEAVLFAEMVLITFHKHECRNEAVSANTVREALISNGKFHSGDIFLIWFVFRLNQKPNGYINQAFSCL